MLREVIVVSFHSKNNAEHNEGQYGIQSLRPPYTLFYEITGSSFTYLWTLKGAAKTSHSMLVPT